MSSRAQQTRLLTPGRSEGNADAWSWRKLNHLAMAFLLGVVVTAAAFICTPLGRNYLFSPRTSKPIATQQPSPQPRPSARQHQRTAKANSPDPQKELERIQAINARNRRLMERRMQPPQMPQPDQPPMPELPEPMGPQPPGSPPTP